MLRALLAGAVIFVIVFGLLRGGEWLYHHVKKTPDWSPHWGTWAFAALSAIYAVVTELGR
jgi:hypothetical protein